MVQWSYMQNPTRIPVILCCSMFIASSCNDGELTGCERIVGSGDVEWYLRCGGASAEDVRGISIDSNGHSYLGLQMRVINSNAPFRIGNTEIEINGSSDILLAKFDSAGENIWVKHLDEEGEQSIWLLRECGDGVAVFGQAYNNSIMIDEEEISQGTFVATFDSAGSLNWSRNLTVGEEYLEVVDIACDADENLTLFGWTDGSLDLGEDSPNLTERGFLAQFDQVGVQVWTRNIGDVYDGAIISAEDDTIMIVGSVLGTADLGGGPMTVDSGDDIIVALLTAEGAHVWSHILKAPGRQYGTALTLDGNGQAVIGGMFLEGVTLGQDNYVNVVPEPSPDASGTLQDAFFARLNDDGYPLSSQHLGTAANDQLYELSFDFDGSLIVSGQFGGEFSLLAYQNNVVTWSWSVSILNGAYFDLKSDVMIVAAAVDGDVDLGSGVLVSRGENDLIMARIRR